MPDRAVFNSMKIVEKLTPELTIRAFGAALYLIDETTMTCLAEGHGRPKPDLRAWAKKMLENRTNQDEKVAERAAKALEKAKRTATRCRIHLDALNSNGHYDVNHAKIA